MKASRSLIALTVAALIPLGTAVAGDHDKAGKGATFDALDANSDGRISQAEAAVDSTIVFSTADANGDGYLDKAEWKASMKAGKSTAPAPQSEPVTPTDPSTPQATEPSSTPQSDMELSAAFMVMTFAVFVVYGLFAASVRDRIVTRPKVMTWLRRAFAGGFAVLGLRLALAER